MKNKNKTGEVPRMISQKTLDEECMSLEESKKIIEEKIMKRNQSVLPKHLKEIKGSLSKISEIDSSEDARLSALLQKNEILSDIKDNSDEIKI